MIKISELNISKVRGTLKLPVEEIQIDNLGIIDDAHRGNWHRQITLLAQESLKKFEIKHNRPTKSGEFAVNILISGLDTNKVSIFDKFKIGKALLEVTQIGKKPHYYNSPVLKDTGENIMFTEGIFTRVINQGKAQIGDIIEYLPKTLDIKIITLSDRAFNGEYEDISGPTIKKMLADYFNKTPWKTNISNVVIPDEKELLVKELNQAVDNKADFIFTTGGTGIGPRDITPDVVTQMADKLIPGIMDWIRIKYGAKKPNALLSRSVTATIDKSIIYTLPGSVKAVQEYTETILETAEHLLLMINGVGH